LSMSVYTSLGSSHTSRFAENFLRILCVKFKNWVDNGIYTDLALLNLPFCACSFSKLEPSHYKMLHRSILWTFDALSGSNPLIFSIL